MSRFCGCWHVNRRRSENGGRGSLHQRKSTARPTMPPKSSKKSAAAPPNKTLVLDNGAYSIKAGLISSASAPTYDDCRVIPNCIARSTRDKRTYVGAELDSCKDFGELAFRRPVEKGFIVNWEAEKAIWEHEFMGDSVEEGLRVGRHSRELIKVIWTHKI
jgi:hypothetical protein